MTRDFSTVDQTREALAETGYLASDAIATTVFLAAALGRPQRQRRRMHERAVADVLHEVLLGDERRHAHPLRALAAHLADTGDVADLLRIHEQHHRVTADAGAHQRVGDVAIAPAVFAQAVHQHHNGPALGLGRLPALPVDLDFLLALETAFGMFHVISSRW